VTEPPFATTSTRRPVSEEIISGLLLKVFMVNAGFINCVKVNYNPLDLLQHYAG